MSRHSVSVAAVVTDHAGRVLVIQRRDNGAWQLPGGVLELEESIEDGLRREVTEETGADITPTELTGVYKNMKLGVVALVFRASYAGGELHPTDEATAVEWWQADRVPTEMNEAFAVRIMDALDPQRRAPAVRMHDGTKLL